MKRKEFASACPKLAESYRLDPSSGTLLNWGLCEEQLNHLATAWVKLRQFVDTVPKDDSRVQLAQRSIVALEKKLPKVRLQRAVDADSGKVTLDGVELRDTSLDAPLPVDPGPHEVVLTLPTGERTVASFNASPGEEVSVLLSRPVTPPPSLTSEPRALPQSTAQPIDGSPSPAVRPARDPAPQPQSHAERNAAYALGAVGVAGLAVSGVFGVLALNNKQTAREHCPDHICRDQVGLDAVSSGSRNVAIANIAFLGGATALAVGAGLWWHSDRASVGVTVGSTSATIACAGTLP